MEMSMDVGTITLVGVVVLVVMVVIFLKVRQKDLIGAMMQKRQAGSKLVSRAEYVEGMERMPVALAITADSLYYENPDLEASFELNRIDEVEYDDELSTGKNIPDHSTVLRLRSHGTTFEFLLEKPDGKKWMEALPPKTTQRPTARAV
jgi:hypothetical protein